MFWPKLVILVSKTHWKCVTCKVFNKHTSSIDDHLRTSHFHFVTSFTSKDNCSHSYSDGELEFTSSDFFPSVAFRTDVFRENAFSHEKTTAENNPTSMRKEAVLDTSLRAHLLTESSDSESKHYSSDTDIDTDIGYRESQTLAISALKQTQCKQSQKIACLRGAKVLTRSQSMSNVTAGVSKVSTYAHKQKKITSVAYVKVKCEKSSTFKTNSSTSRSLHKKGLPSKQNNSSAALQDYVFCVSSGAEKNLPNILSNGEKDKVYPTENNSGKSRSRFKNSGKKRSIKGSASHMDTSLLIKTSRRTEEVQETDQKAIIEKYVMSVPADQRNHNGTDNETNSSKEKKSVGLASIETKQEVMENRAVKSGKHIGMSFYRSTNAQETVLQSGGIHAQSVKTCGNHYPTVLSQSPSHHLPDVNNIVHCSDNIQTPNMSGSCLSGTVFGSFEQALPVGVVETSIHSQTHPDPQTSVDHFSILTDEAISCVFDNDAAITDVGSITCEQEKQSATDWMKRTMKFDFDTAKKPSLEFEPVSEIFECTVCQAKFSSSNLLSDHVTANSIAPIHQCKLCKLTFHNLCDINLHIFGEHERKKKSFCFTCGEQFQEMEAFEVHLYRHKHDRDPQLLELEFHSCRICHADMSCRYAILHRHYYQKHKVPPCFECFVQSRLVVLTDPAAMKEHRQSHEEFCELCLKDFLTADDFKVHLVNHTPVQFLEDGRGQVCERCGQWCPSLVAEELHLKQHKLQLQRHWREQNWSVGMQCLHCDKVLRNKRNLQRHIEQLHSSSKSFRFHCEFCAKGVNSRSALKDHIANVHMGIKRYACKVCHECFASAPTLRRHVLKKHDSDKQYACPHCGKKFCEKSVMKRHIASHTGSSRFMCEACGKGFQSPADFRKHKSVHSERRDYLCPGCGGGYKRPEHLKRHLARCSKYNATYRASSV